MNNLKQSGLNLRNISVVDYAQLVEDIQYNFLQILSHPGFKGVPGRSIRGETGVGVRGSKWIFVKSDTFPNETSSSITLEFINNAFITNAEEFTRKLNIPDNSTLIHGDILVLPSGAVIQLVQDKVTGHTIFVDTGIEFSQVSTLSVEEITKLVAKLTKNITSSKGNVFINAVGKNYHDSSPAGNINATNDAIIDIDTSTSGPGKTLPTRMFFAAPETIVNNDIDVMQVIGSIQVYHRLVQKTLELKNANYGPGIDDWATLAILQNSNKNGIILGAKNSTTLQQFSRIYRSNTALVLTSSYSPYNNEFSEIQLSDNDAYIRTITRVTVESPTSIVNSATFRTNQFDFYDDVLRLGYGSTVTNQLLLKSSGFINLDSADVRLPQIKNAQFLSTTDTGKIINSGYNIGTDIDTANAATILRGDTISQAYSSLNSRIVETNLSVRTNQETTNRAIHNVTQQLNTQISTVQSTIAETERTLSQQIQLAHIARQRVQDQADELSTRLTNEVSTLRNEKNEAVNTLRSETNNVKNELTTSINSLSTSIGQATTDISLLKDRSFKMLSNHPSSQNEVYDFNDKHNLKKFGTTVLYDDKFVHGPIPYDKNCKITINTFFDNTRKSDHFVITQYVDIAKKTNSYVTTIIGSYKRTIISYSDLFFPSNWELIITSNNFSGLVPIFEVYCWENGSLNALNTYNKSFGEFVSVNRSGEGTYDIAHTVNMPYITIVNPHISDTIPQDGGRWHKQWKWITMKAAVINEFDYSTTIATSDDDSANDGYFRALICKIVSGRDSIYNTYY